LNMKKPAAIWMSLVALLVLLIEGCSGTSGPEFGPVTFSPDSKYIVFSYLKGDKSYLFRAAIADGIASRLTKSDCREEYDPVFSPSGEAIAFVCSGHIYLAKKDGSDIHEIVPSDGRDQFPRFSPDGQKLYFARYGSYGNYSPIAQPSAHEWNVFVIDLADKKIQTLTSENFYGIDELSISPDGKEIMVTTLDKGILVYSTDGSVNFREVNPPVHSATADGGKELADAQYTRDGRSIFFMSASSGADGSITMSIK
jgi:Tol biopolymer transport system component